MKASLRFTAGLTRQRVRSNIGAHDERCACKNGARDYGALEFRFGPDHIRYDAGLLLDFGFSRLGGQMSKGAPVERAIDRERRCTGNRKSGAGIGCDE